MTNRLENASSPYLIQHADNPVDWYPWGKDALDKARKEDKPIFLSIGYAACHWCHVMAHESFEDPETASLMNEYFVNIKVDREERPDLDSIYMKATVAMTGQGGWPMSVFLTPDGKPFFAGTYFPPVQRYNMPSFRQVLLSVAKAWNEQRDQLLQNGEQIARRLNTSPSLGESDGVLDPKNLEKAAMALAQSYDWKNGGWGSAPKFPQPMAIEYLLRQVSRGDKMARDIAVHALRSMAKGGMYDVVGGGFARYSVDDRWLVPHFEKMLYDNAQLAQVYLHAYLITGIKFFRSICEKTLDFVLREMSHPEGGFYSSLDADSEGEEGKFYIWTEDEIREVIKDQKDIEFFMTAYEHPPGGNFEGHLVLQRKMDDEALAERFDLKSDESIERLERLHKKLLEVREQRVRPATDDKVLVSWNALMQTAFSEAGRYLGRVDYTRAAIRNAQFLLDHLHTGDKLLRAWREGQANHNAYLEDYAALVLGLISLYQSDPNPQWFSWSMRLAQEMVSNFRDTGGGFFDTRDDHEKLITRPKELQDNATPSGNALAVSALLSLSAYTGLREWRDLAEESLSKIQKSAVRYPTAFGQWLSGLDFAIGEVHEVVILGDHDEQQTQELIDVLWRAYRPRTVVAISSDPPPEGSPPLLQDRHLLNDGPTAFVCQGFVCLSPVNQPLELNMQLDGGL